MRKRLCAFCLGILPLQPTSYAQSGGERCQEITEARLDELGASTMPGVAFATVARGEVGEIGAAGVKRLGSDEPIGPDTPFLIGSISKSFTAIGVMQLVEAGQVALDDPIARHLPAFADNPSGAITVRQLLSHTSGYSTYQGNSSEPGDPRGKDAIALRADRLAATTPAYGSGEVWEYSNANYVILGRLIEVVSGQTFSTYVTNNVLKPAGMEHSFVSDGERHAAMATGHTPWFGSKRPLPDNRTNLGLAPQGGVVANVSDLARYMLLMMNRQDDIISSEAKAEMMKPASEVSPFYGLGWFLDVEDGTVWHSGSTPGVETLLTMMPAEGKGVVVLVNAGSGVGFGETAQLCNGITARALGLEYTGEGSRLWQKATFIALVLLPLVYLSCMIWAWRQRGAIRAKSGPAGAFSLWFPLLTTLAATWVILSLIPSLFGVPLSALNRHQPDLVLAMIASAATGVLWAAFRLGVAQAAKSD